MNGTVVDTSVLFEVENLSQISLQIKDSEAPYLFGWRAFLEEGGQPHDFQGVWGEDSYLAARVRTDTANWSSPGLPVSGGDAIGAYRDSMAATFDEENVTHVLVTGLGMELQYSLVADRAEPIYESSRMFRFYWSLAPDHWNVEREVWTPAAGTLKANLDLKIEHDYNRMLFRVTGHDPHLEVKGFCDPWTHLELGAALWLHNVEPQTLEVRVETTRAGKGAQASAMVLDVPFIEPGEEECDGA